MAMQREFDMVFKEFEGSVCGSEDLKVSLKESSKFSIRGFSNNEFFNVLKNGVERFVRVEKSEVIEVTGTGVLNILVEKDCDLMLKFDKRCSVFVRMIIKNGVRINLSQIVMSSDVFKVLDIVCENSSFVNFSSFVLKGRLDFTRVFLSNDCSYDLSHGYFMKAEECFMRYEVSHMGTGSVSNQVLKGASIGGSRVICDGAVRICDNGSGSDGQLQISGLILDESSKIFSEPILEVSNNDVKCSHGCSISQIADDIRFYMKSRGVGYDDIVRLTVLGFFGVGLERLSSKFKEDIEFILDDVL